MKARLFLFLLLVCTLPAYTQLTWGPYEYNFSATSEFANNFSGGLKRGYTYYGLEQATIKFNTDSARTWKGGNFFVHILNAHGIGPTHKFVGDLMYLSNIESGDYLGLFEFWYTQEIGKFVFLFGQHDMNTEFAGTKYGDNFINSSYGVISNVALNVPVSVYPVAAPCILTKYSVTDNLVIKAAIYNGDPGTMEDNKFNFHWHFSKAIGTMNLFEAQYTEVDHVQNGIHTSKGIQTGTYKVGFFYHTGEFTNYADTTIIKKGNYGIYFIADKMIIPKPSKLSEGLAMLLELGYSPSKFNLINYSAEGGIRYYGILQHRARDFIGLAFTYAGLSKYFMNTTPHRTSSECSLELTYKFQFAKHYNIQPDFQYIIHPGAISTISYAFAGLLRIQLAL